MYCGWVFFLWFWEFSKQSETLFENIVLIFCKVHPIGRRIFIQIQHCSIICSICMCKVNLIILISRATRFRIKLLMTIMLILTTALSP